ncbi:hypothetical protein MD484_g3424, partial [Candolleomyces efflorescens]
MPYPTSPNSNHYGTNSASSYPENGNGNYGLASSDDGSNYSDQYPSNGSTPQTFCPCRSNPAYLNLSQQLHSTLSSLRQFSHHPPNTGCLIYRRVTELNDLVQFASSSGTEHTNGSSATANGATSYDSSTPSDNELLTPLSASSGGHAPFPTSTSSPGMPPQEWNNIGNGGYNPYFPMPPGDHHAVYAHVIT